MATTATAPQPDAARGVSDEAGEWEAGDLDVVIRYGRGGVGLSGTVRATVIRRAEGVTGPAVESEDGQPGRPRAR